MGSTSNKSVPEMAIEWKFLARKINYKQQGGAPQTLYWLVVKPPL